MPETLIPFPVHETTLDNGLRVIIVSTGFPNRGTGITARVRLVKAPGRRVKAGGSVATVESSKWVGPIHTPYAGEVVETNDPAFAADILTANRDPYGAGWLVRIAPTDLDNELDLLQDGAEAFELYRDFIDENEVRCFRCED